MRCKLGDRVIVIEGSASGAVGTIVDDANPYAAAFMGCHWIVEFPRPVPGMSLTGPTTSRIMNFPDRCLQPLPDDPELIQVAAGAGVPA